MKRYLIAGAMTVVLGGSWLARAAEMPQLPPPTKEHKWLQKFVGQWEGKMTIPMEPGKPPMTVKTKETVKSLGGYWVVGESKGDMMGPYTGMMTVGYDTTKKRYSGTYVDSSNAQLWQYTGAVSGNGKILTLAAEGPCPMMPGKNVQWKDVTEFKSNTHRVMTSSMLGPDGKWVKVMTIESWKKN